MFTSDEFLTTAKVLREYLGPEDQIDFYELQAKKLRDRDEYAKGLGKLAWKLIPYSETNRGLNIMSQLIEDGWTAPEGLL